MYAVSIFVLLFVITKKIMSSKMTFSSHINRYNYNLHKWVKKIAINKIKAKWV